MEAKPWLQKFSSSKSCCYKKRMSCLFFHLCPLFRKRYKFFYFNCNYIPDAEWLALKNMIIMIQLRSCCQYNTHSDWVIVGSLFSHTAHRLILGLQKQSKKPIKTLLTVKVHSLWESLKPQPCNVDFTIVQSIWQSLSLRFSFKDFMCG